MIIVDDAYRLAGSSTDVARYRLGKALSSSAPYLLLLTATPYQGKTDACVREEAERKISAINLRKEAVMRIGLESVHKHRLSQLEAEERALLEAVKKEVM